MHLPQIIYLHGFASSPGSTKAIYFGERLKEAGFNVVIPDLNTPDFTHMTITSQLKLVKELVDNSPDSNMY